MKDEIDEERHLWNTIRADGRRFDQLMVSISPSVLPRGASRLLLGLPQEFDIDTFHTAHAYGNPSDTHHTTLSKPNATDRESRQRLNLKSTSNILPTDFPSNAKKTRRSQPFHCLTDRCTIKIGVL
jgi:hypothetical protein